MRKTLHNTLLSLLHTFLFCLRSSSWKKKKNPQPHKLSHLCKKMCCCVCVCLPVCQLVCLWGWRTVCSRVCVWERECKYRLLWHCMFIVPMKLLELNWVEFREQERERKSRWRIKCECRTQWCVLGRLFFFFYRADIVSRARVCEWKWKSGVTESRGKQSGCLSVMVANSSDKLVKKWRVFFLR